MNNLNKLLKYKQTIIRAIIICLISIFGILFVRNCIYKSHLKHLINTVVISDNYTPRTYDEYKRTLSDAKTFYWNFFFKDDDLKDISTKLEDQIEKLEKKPSKISLWSQYNKSLLIDKSKYVPLSLKNVKDVQISILNVLNDVNATREDINVAESEINNCIKNLIEIPDKTKLDELYKKMCDVNLDLYLKESLDEFTFTLENAKEILDYDSASQEEVDGTMLQLENGYNLLIKKPDKSNLKRMLNDITSISEGKYTSASYKQLVALRDEILPIYENEEATPDEVKNAEIKLQNGFNQLIFATKGVYRISISTHRISNNHVGNNWSRYFYYNGQEISGYETITAYLNSSVYLSATIIERDSVPDVGSGGVNIILGGNEASTLIYVRENRGRYSGNLAVWEITCSSTLVERI